MDINKLIENVNNVDEYIYFTQELTDKYKNTKVNVNITNVLALKKLKSLEIEYLDKCCENGAACIIFERLLSLPPSKTWAVLAKELVSLLQYWLEAIRKYLINHSDHWWTFLKLILKFIMKMHQKDKSNANMLVELTAECLFDIASRDEVDVLQRHELLHYLNMVCAESNREIRFALRNKFGLYFTKLGNRVATSGYLPVQYSTVEALVRWLVPRQDMALRAAAVDRWFPPDLCPEAARQIFLTTPWIGFKESARDFLNALNEAKGYVVSEVCRRLTIRDVQIISGAENHKTWVDINLCENSITVLLDPSALETFGVTYHRAFETLMITGDNTQSAILQSESQELTLSVTTFSPARVLPQDVPLGEGSGSVRIVLSSRVRLERLNVALTNIFGDKYLLLMDLNTELSLSLSQSRGAKNIPRKSDDDTRFSLPVEVKRRKHYGYMATSRAKVSPSTASTSSLAHLHEKLPALPHRKRKNVLARICAEPEVSSVTEKTESDARSFHSKSTLKLTSYGVCSFTGNSNKNKAESDTEIINRNSSLNRHLFPKTWDHNSLLYAATHSKISNTVKSLPKNKDNQNIVDLLVREALHATPIPKETAASEEASKIQNLEDNSEAIDNTPSQGDGKKPSMRSKAERKRICTVVSKSTTEEESNTEAINETPWFVPRNRSKLSRRKSVAKAVTKPKVIDKQSFDVKTVEQFFSQHFTETKKRDIEINPNLARKINDTRSDTSANFDENYLNINKDLNITSALFEVNETEIIECLNNMVDKVCTDFDKCAEYLEKKDVPVSKTKTGPKDKNKIRLIETDSTNDPMKQADLPSKPKRVIKPVYKTIKERKPRAVTQKRRNSIVPKGTKKMSTIIEQKYEEANQVSSSKDQLDADCGKTNSPTVIQNENKLSADGDSQETPITKRKRKLYSPKDDEVNKEKKSAKESSIEEENIALSKYKSLKQIKAPTEKSKKSTATCYKEIEKERKKQLPRSKKARGKVEESPSPRTLKKYTVFDKLKKTVENNEKITVVDKKTIQSDVFNFTSESEDEDFKKKNEIRKRSSTTNTKPTKRGRQRAQKLHSEKASNDEAKQNKKSKNKAVKKTSDKSKANLNIESDNILADEKMREAVPEELNTSMVIEIPKTTTPALVELVLREPPQMEPIPDDQETSKSSIKRKPNRKTKKVEKSARNKKKQTKNDQLKIVSDKEDDRTVSPLPGLVVEAMPSRDDANDALTATMLQKFKEIYKDGRDPIESSNTQNLILSDIERCNYSTQNVSEDIRDKVCAAADKESKNIRVKKSKPNMPFKTEDINMKCKDVSGEVIEIVDKSDGESEMSIETDGITGHGDSDEAPPNSDMLKKKLPPRELDNLDEPLSDYYLKLYREVHKSPSIERERSKSIEETGSEKGEQSIFENNSRVQSPVVHKRRLSPDDASRWIISRKTSETDGSVKSSINVTDITDFPKATEFNTNNVDKVHAERQQAKPIFIRPNVKSPPSSSVVPPDEVDMWLPMPKRPEHKDATEINENSLHRDSILKLVYNTRQKSKNMNNDTKIVKRTYKKVIPKKHAVTGNSNTIINNSSVCKNVSERDAIAKKSKARAVANSTDLESDSDCKQLVRDKRSSERQNVRSFISPVRSLKRMSFEDSDDGVGNKLRDILTKEFGSKTSGTKARTSIGREQIVNLSQDFKRPTILSQEATSSEVREIEHNRSISKRIDDLSKCPIRRKSSTLHDDPKNVRFDAGSVNSASSIASVNDWFTRCESSKCANDASLSNDTMGNVLEKLDTTLMEKNHNTSKMLLNLSVILQQNLDALKEDRRDMMKCFATEINHKLKEMDKKMEAKETQLKEHIKKQTFDIVKQDCERSRAMVRILKEDVQMASKYIKRRRTE